MVTDVQQVEALCNGKEATGLGSCVSILGNICAVHDPRQQVERRIIEVVVLNENLERAEAVAVRIRRAGSVIRVCAFALGGSEHLVGWDVDELGLGVDEVLDQPRTRDPVGLRTLAGDPFHHSLLSSARDVPVAQVPGGIITPPACQADREP
jgi:hypothetical protein